ncbi:DUF445 domain-containing protein [Weeksella virosa]|uniref:DUF445 domain-containing protein n=1 Tax=Weeksella virosa (strain ATCC 43766 / DSM 16922 / JCM 21250 / CCUG 30538 / CDC 9751 / IAM 14551 / NBRC 16016 / NCTC 11634 / CL345/78) TaxID=865938 RepID=F0NXI7_WEEVC|nr:DUF445 domain-containing protein [Weeksella virosa]ADX67977.1 protein of unknown function DUF445 [Weeksella virosa DSM 16922]VEH64389.1 Predicted membrane protein [Weeksella virosa]
MTTDEKKKQLRKHKAIATGLFVLMTLLYLWMVFLEQETPKPWMGYVKAFSEAAMVGALADWFAVTALFRYPLGLKIPHTNLIERSKNAIGDNLGNFVQTNFLTPTNIRPYIEKLDVVSLANNWLKKPDNQHLLEEELMNISSKIVRDLNDEDVVNFLSDKGAEMLRQFDLQALVASSVNYMLDRNKHTEIINAILPKAIDYMYDSNGIIKEKLEEKHPIISMFVGKRISKGVVEGVVTYLEEIQQDEQHEFRLNIEKSLREVVDKISTSPDWKHRLSVMRDDFITDERMKYYTVDLWKTLKESLTQSFEEENSTMRNYLRKNIEKLALTLETDNELQRKINGWIRLFIYRLILRNVGEVELLISKTVDNWSGRELSNKLELEVGKDLQYIRVNGTLVGGLVGLIIYTITQLITN